MTDADRRMQDLLVGLRLEHESQGTMDGMRMTHDEASSYMTFVLDFYLNATPHEAEIRVKIREVPAPNRKVSPGLRRRVKEGRIKEARANNGGELSPVQRTQICGAVDRELDELEEKGLLG